MTFVYGLKEVNPGGTEWWIIHNYERRVSCSSELACWRIIDLAKYANGETDEKPENYTTLERKASWLVFGKTDLIRRRE